MKFTILSHAGMRVEHDGFELVIDPWLLGSCYWRSWWNYPPVPRELRESLRPNAIYLTHIHWDHFHGPSLKTFPRSTPIYVPKGHHDRIRRDLRTCGFKDVRELRHGETVALTPELKLTSWQFFPFLDSAAVIEGGGVTLFDANDAKFMGAPLRQILDRHPRIDFVFRSHSSANSRLCYEVVDAPDAPVDDSEAYVASFAAFTQATRAAWAIPFASNHCFLHDDVIGLNHTVQTPWGVKEHFARQGIVTPRVQVMLSGDRWDQDAGFAIDPEQAAWFTDRDARIAAYRARVQPKLDAFAAREARARVEIDLVRTWASGFSARLPAAIRWLYRQTPVTFVLRAGEDRRAFRVDLWRGTAEQVAVPDGTERDPMEVHTSAFIFLQCVRLDLFAHLGISKRVRYRVSRRTKRLMQLLNLLWEATDYDLLPLATLDRARAREVLTDRWREVALFGRIGADVLAGRGFDQARYLRDV